MAPPSKDLLEWWRPKLRALDPWREVGLGEIHELYAERQRSPYRSLATNLRLARHPSEVKIILCGALGCGKTTELTRLAHDVKGDFCVIKADLADGLPDEASTLAVVTLLGVASLHALKLWSAPDADLATLLQSLENPVGRGANLLQTALSRFGEALPSVATLIEGVSHIVTLFDPRAGTGLAAAKSVITAARVTTSVTSKLRHDLARGPLEGRLQPDQRDDAQAVVKAVNGILDELQSLSGRPPLLLADGLDKRPELDKITVALGEEYLLRELDAALVLSGAAPGNFKLSLLYNVPVWRREENGDVVHEPEGISVLRDLYQRRRSEAGFPENLFAEQLIEQAAKNCAGIVRDFLRLLEEAGKNALNRNAYTANDQDLEIAIKTLRLEMEGFLDEQDLRILRRVLDKGTLPASPEADTLLFGNFIACYHNGDIWFRPHELIVQFVRGQRADL